MYEGESVLCDVLFDKKFQKSLRGRVEFDFGEMADRHFGIVRIRGKFSRLKPRYERDIVTPVELTALKVNLGSWVKRFFNTGLKPKYFEELVDTTCLFAAYTDPFHNLESTEFNLNLKLTFWMWHIDDVLELAIKTRVIKLETFNKFASAVLGVFKDDLKTFREREETLFDFHHFFNSLVDLQESLQERHSNFKTNLGPFCFFFQRYFEAMRWYLVSGVGKEYSQETFRYWRRIVAFFDGLLEFICLLDDEVLPDNIWNAPSFRRILDIGNSLGGFVNDVLGFKKEIELEQSDNLVVFKICQKGVPLKKAFKEVCNLIDDELKDYLLLRDTVLREFSYHPSLIKYLHVWESFMDGHNRIYLYSTRHYCRGCVKLTE